MDSVKDVGMIQRNENWKQAEKSTDWQQHKKSLIRKVKTIDINEYHKTFGRQSEAITHISLQGKFNPCEDCALGESRQNM